LVFFMCALSGDIKSIIVKEYHLIILIDKILRLSGVVLLVFFMCVLTCL
jgi:hypothetical protein